MMVVTKTIKVTFTWGLLCDVYNWMPSSLMRELRLKEVKSQQSLELDTVTCMEKQEKANMPCHYKINNHCKIAQVLEK